MYRLCICMPIRDRKHLTIKAIESIWKNTTKVAKKNINIYAFDNKSDLSDERAAMFYNLLKQDKIKYYSYDTSESTYNCFGKAVTFQRWIKMMITERNMYSTISPGLDGYRTFYVLMDNDMLLGPGWDEYFISAAEQVERIQPDTHMLIKSPGGVPESCRQDPQYKIKNVFDGSDISIQPGIGGGGSGFWFMTYNMLNKVMWDDRDLKYTFNVDKRHDSTTWRLIHDKNGICKYNAAVVPPSEDNPLVLHLGGRIGSICNQLVKGKYNGDVKKGITDMEDHEIEGLSVDDLWTKYKDIAGIW